MPSLSLIITSTQWLSMWNSSSTDLQMVTQKWALTPGYLGWDEPRAIPSSQEVYRKIRSYKLDHAIVHWTSIVQPTVFIFFFSHKPVVSKSLFMQRDKKETLYVGHGWKLCFESLLMERYTLWFSFRFLFRRQRIQTDMAFKFWWVNVSFFNYCFSSTLWVYNRLHNWNGEMGLKIWNKIRKVTSLEKKWRHPRDHLFELFTW